MLSYLFSLIWNATCTASIGIAVVLLLRQLLQKLLSSSFAYCLWGIVLIQLFLPISIPSPFAVQNLSAKLPDTFIQQEPVFQTTPLPQDSAAAKAQTISSEPISSGPAPSPSTIPSETTTPDTPTTQKADLSSSSAGNQPFPLIPFLWLIGALLSGGICLCFYLRLAAALREATLSRWDGIAGMRIYSSSVISSPVTFGLAHPKIILPASYEEYFTEEVCFPSETCYSGGEPVPEELLCIVEHESYHIRRKDFLIKPLFLAAACLHWFNPLVWVSFFLFSRDMELSCDEHVISSSSRVSRTGYASTLLSLGQQVSSPAYLVSFGSNNLKLRIEHVIRFKRRSLWVTAAAVLTAGLLVFSLAGKPVMAEQNTPSSANSAMDNKTMDHILDTLQSTDHFYIGFSPFSDFKRDPPSNFDSYYTLVGKDAKEISSLFKGVTYQPKMQFVPKDSYSICLPIDEGYAFLDFLQSPLDPQVIMARVRYQNQIAYYNLQGITYTALSKSFSPYISFSYDRFAESFAENVLVHPDPSTFPYLSANLADYLKDLKLDGLKLSSDVTITDVTPLADSSVNLKCLSFDVAESGNSIFPVGKNRWILDIRRGDLFFDTIRSHAPYAVSFRPEGKGADLENTLRLNKENAVILDSVLQLVQTRYFDPFDSPKQIPIANRLLYFVGKILDDYCPLDGSSIIIFSDQETVSALNSGAKKVFGMTEEDMKQFQQFLYDLDDPATRSTQFPNTVPLEKINFTSILEAVSETDKESPYSISFSVCKVDKASNRAVVTSEFYQSPFAQAPYRVIDYTLQLNEDDTVGFLSGKEVPVKE